MKVIHALDQDVDKLKDPTKKSGMFLDTSDIDYLTDNVIEELKKH